MRTHLLNLYLMANVRCPLHRLHRHRRRPRLLLRVQVPQARVSSSEVVATNVDREWRALDVLAVVLDGDEVLSGHHGRVANLVPFLHFVARQVHLWGTVDRNREGSGTNTGSVNDESWRFASHPALDALAGHPDGGGVIVAAVASLTADDEFEWRARNVNAVEFGVLKKVKIIISVTITAHNIVTHIWTRSLSVKIKLKVVFPLRNKIAWQEVNAKQVCLMSLETEEITNFMAKGLKNIKIMSFELRMLKRYQVMCSLFFRHKSNTVLSFSKRGDEAIVLAAAGCDDLALHVAVGPVHVEEHRLGNVRRDRAVCHVRQPHAFGLISWRLNVNLNKNIWLRKIFLGLGVFDSSRLY